MLKSDNFKCGNLQLNFFLAITRQWVQWEGSVQGSKIFLHYWVFFLKFPVKNHWLLLFTTRQSLCSPACWSWPHRLLLQFTLWVVYSVDEVITPDFSVHMFAEFIPVKITVLEWIYLFFFIFYRLELSPNQVRSVFICATQLKMERPAKECANYLVKNLTNDSCIEIRRLTGISRQQVFLDRVDSFIKDNVSYCLIN